MKPPLATTAPTTTAAAAREVHSARPSTPARHRECVTDPALAADVVAGLSREGQRTLPSKWFYDRRGSGLFEDITRLPEYYLTRTEAAIMREHAPAMADAIGERALLVELGSGNSTKTRLLLDHLTSPAGYVPVDISRDYFLQAARSLKSDYPEVEVLPLVGDYHQPLTLPSPSKPPRRNAVYFPGSTLGNMHSDEAAAFLTRVARWCQSDADAPCGLLIGVDLVKPTSILVPAYDDAAAVTAEFNYNLLDRINREARGDFSRHRWAHRALWNPELSRMESHLESLDEQRVRVAGENFHFERGETIRTECSYKYTLDSLQEAASAWELRQHWMDERGYFVVAWFVASSL